MTQTMKQQAHIPTSFSLGGTHAVTIAPTPFTDGRPDPRTETAPQRGIVSRKPRSVADLFIAELRAERNRMRAGKA